MSRRTVPGAPLWQRTMWTMHGMNGSMETENPLHEPTTITDDVAGRQNAILDGRGIQSTFYYDAANQRTAQLSTNDAPVTYGNDEVGNHSADSDGVDRRHPHQLYL
jgi:hypothetical protein